MISRALRFAAVLLILCVAGCQARGNAKPARDAAFAGNVDLHIRDVTVVNSEEKPAAGMDILVSQGRIVAIQRVGGKVNAAKTIDGRGRYLIPGLIDSHVHLYHATGLRRGYTQRYAELYAAHQRQQPRSYLYYGFTTVIELSADPEANRRFEQGPEHPDLIHCGRGVPVSNGYEFAIDFDGDAREFFSYYSNFVHDRHTTPSLPSGFDPAEFTPAKVVARIAESGGRCVKLYYEEAHWWPGEKRPAFELPSEAIVKEIVEQAHQRKMPVLLHGTTPAAYRIALAAGVDILAHGLWDWPDAMHGQPQIPAEAFAAADAAARGIAVQPTVRAVAGSLSMFEPAFLNDPALARVLPSSYVDYLRTEAQAGRDEYLRRFGPALERAHARGAAPTAEVPVVMRTYLDRSRTLLRRMNEQGVRLLFGTDTAAGTFGWGNPPGLNGHWEMRAWVDAGIDLQTLLRAATLDNAKAFGLEQDVGSISVGKRANLILLRKNPLDTVEAYDAIDLVILHGQTLARESLAAQ